MTLSHPAPTRAPQPGDVLRIPVESLDDHGRGRAVARARLPGEDQDRTWTVEVPGAMPGDDVSFLVRGRRRGTLQGRIEGVTLAPDSPAGPCPHAAPRRDVTTGCGGCALPRMPYAVQLQRKHAALVEVLREAGLSSCPAPAPVLGMDHPWGYRNKVELSFARGPAGELTLGLYPAGFHHEVVDLQTCLLMPDDLPVWVDASRRVLRAYGLPPFSARRGEGLLRTLTVRCTRGGDSWMVELTVAAADEAMAEVRSQAWVQDWQSSLGVAARARGLAPPSVHLTLHRARKGMRTSIETVHLEGPPTLVETLEVGDRAPLRFEIHPRAFFQPNPAQACRLYAQVREALRAGGRRGVLLDLYCGTGTIGLCMADLFDRVVGVEISEEAIANARCNAARHGILHTEWIAAPAGQALETLDLPAHIDAVVVDPPRTGLDAGTRQWLVDRPVPRLVYVSCQPATLARDLATLVAAGYQIEAVQPVDMFAHTVHLETVVRLHHPVGPHPE